MKQIVLNRILYILLLNIFTFTSFSNSNITLNNNYVHDVIIVKFKPNSSLFKLLRKAAPISISNSLRKEDVPFTNTTLLKFFSDFGLYSFKAVKPDAGENPLPGGVERIFILNLKDTNSNAIIGSLTKAHEIEYAEHDFIGYVDDKTSDSELLFNNKFPHDPNDPLFPDQWGLKNTGQFVGGVPEADINIIPAWEISTGNSETIVAVLDSGIPLDNPEFNGRIIPGYDFVHNNDNPQDDFGHGTLVTGVIGAIGNNGIQICGINWKCKIFPLKVLNSIGSWTASNGASAIIYATDHGANVINFSAYITEFSHSFQDAVLYAYNNSVIFVTGNGNFNNDIILYPAGFSNVIAVGAITDENKRASFSNYGKWLDFVAPGNAIISLKYSDPNGFQIASGTSMATAFVTGLVSLMVGLRNDLTFQDVYGLLKRGAKDQIGNPSEDTPGWDQYYGWGCINAGKTMQYLIDTIITHPVPDNYYLSQNYPNPFNFNTTINFGITVDEFVNLNVYNLLGQKVTTLVNQFKKAGQYTVYWDGYEYGSNVYFYVLRAGNFLESKKMILVK